MKKSLIYTVLLGAIMLVGCGSKTDANERNFGAAIADQLKKNEFCLPFEKWPYRVVANDSARLGQMAVLETAGLVSGADFETDELNFFRKPTGRKIKLKIYNLTGEGKKFFHENGAAKAADVVNGNLCYGKLALTKVVKWEGTNSPQNIIVTYSTKLDDLADWAKKPELQAVFPGTAKFIAEGLAEKENKTILKLTSLGWESAMGFGLASSAGSEPVIVVPDWSMPNPADYLPVATPVANVVSAPTPALVSQGKVETPPTQLHSSAAKHPQVQKTATKNDKNSAKESSTPQVRHININD